MFTEVPFFPSNSGPRRRLPGPGGMLELPFLPCPGCLSSWSHLHAQVRAALWVLQEDILIPFSNHRIWSDFLKHLLMLGFRIFLGIQFTLPAWAGSEVLSLCSLPPSGLLESRAWLQCWDTLPMGSAEIQEFSLSSTELLLTVWQASRRWVPHCIFGSTEAPRNAVGQLLLDYRGRPSGLMGGLGDQSPPECLPSVALLVQSWSWQCSPQKIWRTSLHKSFSLFSLLTQISFGPEISCPLCLFKSPGVCVGPTCPLQFSTGSGSTLDPLMSCCKQGTIALSFHH